MNPRGRGLEPAELARAAVAHGAMQKPDELAALIELVGTERPRTIVEIGTGVGGTLFVWCRLAAVDATIVSIDLPGGLFGGGYEQARIPLLKSFAGPAQTVHLVQGDSGRIGTWRDVKRLLDGRPIDLLYVDGDHTYYGVRTDFLQYAPLVRNGGVIVLHDILEINTDPRVEVPRIWKQLRRRSDYREVVHHDSRNRWGGFGILRWKGTPAEARLDLSPQGDGFAVPDLSARPALESVEEIETVLGPVLVPHKDEVITPFLRRCGTWQPFETAYFRRLLQPGQTFVDVGAHVGFFSVLASKLVGPTGVVIAVEPEPRNFDLLCRNLVRNRCTNALVVPFAAHSERGWMSLALDEVNRGGHRLVPLGDAPMEVRCVCLDDILPSGVDVVKIDAQGYDHDVVGGMERTLATNPRAIVVSELSLGELERRGVAPEAVLAHYETLGFTISIFDGPDLLRRASAEMAIERSHAGDCSLVLERPAHRLALAAKPMTPPCQAEGLDVNETSDGLMVSQPVLNRVHYLNHIAAIVFDLCTGDHEFSEIASRVQAIYNLAEPPEYEVEGCLRDLYGKGLVVQAPRGQAATASRQRAEEQVSDIRLGES